MVSDHWPTHMNLSGDLRKVFQAIELRVYPRGFVPSRTNQYRWRALFASSSVCDSQLAVTTVVGFLDTRTVSSSAEFRSFLLSMCIETPESTTNYLSSVFRWTPNRRGEKCSFVLFCERENTFLPFSTRLCGRIAHIFKVSA